MAAPALLAGPVIRIAVLLVLLFVILSADFGGLVDTAFYEIEQLIQSLISPF